MIVEQPNDEAMLTARRLEKQLMVAIFLALLGTIVLG